MTLDVTTRLGVRGPVLEDFARPTLPTTGQLARHVLTRDDGAAQRRCQRGPAPPTRAERALPALRDAFDVIVCDLPGGPSGPGSVLGNRLEQLDWLVLAVTPEPAAVAAASHFLELFETARTRGDVGSVELAIVCTGDENSAVLDRIDVEAGLGRRASRLGSRSCGAEPSRTSASGPRSPSPISTMPSYDLLVSFVRDRDLLPVLTAG